MKIQFSTVRSAFLSFTIHTVVKTELKTKKNVVAYYVCYVPLNSKKKVKNGRNKILVAKKEIVSFGPPT